MGLVDFEISIILCIFAPESNFSGMYNNELKTIDTKEKAYLLGFLYSDGNICISNNHCVTSIVQKNEDAYILEIFVKLFPFFHLSKHSENASVIKCYSKELFQDLERIGLVQQKSTINREKLLFPVLDKELESHFIRGYFDGDGSVYRQKKGNTKIEIGGAGFNIITSIIHTLYDNRITVNLTCRYTGEGLRRQDFYKLYTSSDKVSKKFANYIYRDCGSLYLKRKFNKLYYIPKYNKPEKLICPRCGGINTVRMGIRETLRGYVQRGICKDCNKGFTLTAPQDSNILSGEGELLEG